MTPYPHYKPSHIAWLGDIPEHWEVNQIKRTLRLLTDYDANGSFSDINKNVNRTDIDIDKYAWFVRTTDLEKYKSEKDLNDFVWIDKVSYFFLKKSKLVGGDLLLAKRGDIGRVYLMPYVNVPTSLAPNLYLARLNNKHITSKFAYYFLMSDKGQYQLNLRNKSTTLGALYKDDFKSLEFVFPPLSEQAAIATYLDRKTQAIDKKIELLTQKITHYQHLRKTLINETVCRGLDKDVPLKDSGISWIGKIPRHWEVRRVRDLVKINEKALPESTINDFSFKYIDIGNVNQNGIVSEPETVLFGNAPSRARRIVRKHDIIVSTVRTYLKAVAYFDFDPKEYIVSTGFAVLTPKKVIPQYLSFYTQSDIFVDTVVKLSTGVSYPAINAFSVSLIHIHCPPLPEQTAIAQYLDQQTQQIDHIVKNLQKQIELLRELRKTLINEVVTGKVQVVDL